MKLPVDDLLLLKMRPYSSWRTKHNTALQLPQLPQQALKAPGGRGGARADSIDVSRFAQLRPEPFTPHFQQKPALQVIGRKQLRSSIRGNQRCKQRERSAAYKGRMTWATCALSPPIAAKPGV